MEYSRLLINGQTHVQYSFDNGEIPKYFDNYFSDIWSGQKYQTKLASLQKHHLPTMKTSMGQLTLKYIGPEIWTDILILSHYSFGNKYKYSLLSCLNSCWFSFHVCHFSAILFSVSLIFLKSLPLQLLNPPLVHRHAFPCICCCCFVYLFYLTWFDEFCYFSYNTCEKSSMKNWFMLATGMAEQLTHMAFGQPFAIQIC